MQNVFCIHRLRLKPGDKTLECLTSDLVQKVGKMWSLFLGSTTSFYYRIVPMVPSAVRSHLINQHTFEINMIKIILLNIYIHIYIPDALQKSYIKEIPFGE